jgi:hypothetical protein
MSTLSRKCIDVIKAAAMENIGSQPNITKAIKDAGIQVANPHCYVQDAIRELEAEGLSVIRKGRVWYVEGKKEQEQPPKLDTGVPTVHEIMEALEAPTEAFLPFEKKADKKKESCTSRVNLTLLNVETNVKELLNLLGAFDSFVKNKKVVVSVQVKQKED